ncbi:E3 SUMO-protein ligase KIAA1586-like [Myzus persicae]|uniref:E3 SUMO-protein ligase KIAA1586-like n=1 Tax=Myzus persicae TaxID=13164 RepID=UPI000B9300A5|nr:E3 SUMO-protein ligase KIAA1586-like [Myzus persicae]XP_022182074.1 E3 SUMO-protein ligase KIAA1586-like [Myzus persicae]
MHEKNSDNLTKQFENIFLKINKSTVTIFRTAYYISKNNRPFSDHSKLLELQNLNGINTGITLQSRFSCTQIIAHISMKMKEKIVSNIVKSGSKISVLIDESTTLSTLSTMVVYIKTSISSEDPISIFLDLVELNLQTADNIVNQLIDCLHISGFDDNFLKNNWISFVSDGASVLVGKKKGVAKQLKRKYPLIFSWHCLNHRLELAVNDTMKDLNAINHFKSFIDSLYVLYNNSPKNKNEIKEICSELDIIFLKIGRVLDIRWVASSWRAVQAVWRTFPALCKHFLSSSTDTTKDSKSRSKYLGLYNKLCSPEFLLDLSLMCDVLSELSTLSLHLQKQTITLLEADSSIKRTIRVIESFKNNSGDHMRTADIAKRDMTFKNIKLSHFSKIVPINKNQFITSICNNLKERLLENEDDFYLIQDISIIDKTTWPSNVDIRYGEKEIKRLCQRFMLNKDNAINGFRVYLDSNGLQNTIVELVNCIKTFPCSTADCERGFSLLNLICTDLRNKLTVSNIANLMFLNINGPPLNQWNPEEYVKSWLISQHRDADDTRTKILKTDEPNIEYKKSLWNIL